MKSSTPYDEVVNYLLDTIGSTLNGLGIDDERVKPLTEAQIIDYFEKYIYKEMNNYFLIGDSDAIYIYNGSYYETSRNNEDIMMNIIKDAMKAMGIGLVYQKTSYLKIFKQCLSGMKITSKAHFTPNRDYVVFTNGVLDLKTKMLHPFSMDFRTDIILDFDYKPGYENNLWNNIIISTIPDNDSRKTFQMFCGAFLINRKNFSIEYICYLLGSGRNGKSVITGAIANVFGENLVSSFSLQELLYDNDKTYNRASLVGKIANFSDDVSKKDYSGGAYKQLISGHKMTARHPYGRPFDLVEIPYLVCCVNEMPPTTDDTQGHYRRMLLISCPNQVSDKDADESLPAKLSTKEVKSAIINWIIEGRDMLIASKGKIEVSESIREAVKEQQEMGNSARRWIKDSNFVKVVPIGKDDPRYHLMPYWMKLYKEYCSDMCESSPKLPQQVGKIFKEMGFAYKKGSNNAYWCIGQLNVDTNDVGGLISENNIVDNDLPF